ncbi:hypothetical protein PIB30_053408 [Stylosanthes scabra]|uniref:Uncharacterized protein n=1 Tax=Stylosanthes scabra TaxID=79078 RepID=A0ABU6WI21_9FABA|nr:hypothetical protein [Stylosanthes scabra]
MVQNSLRVSKLTKEATTWLHLIFDYIQLNTHLTTITIEMAIILYCILDEKRVHLHKLMHKKISLCKGKGHSAWGKVQGYACGVFKSSSKALYLQRFVIEPNCTFVEKDYLCGDTHHEPPK